jgi:hypothetical protein
MHIVTYWPIARQRLSIHVPWPWDKAADYWTEIFMLKPPKECGYQNKISWMKMLICLFDGKGTVAESFSHLVRLWAGCFVSKFRNVCMCEARIVAWQMHVLSLGDFRLWWRIRSWSWNTPLTHQISVRMSCSSFMPWRIISSDDVLLQCKGFRRLQKSVLNNLHEDDF